MNKLLKITLNSLIFILIAGFGYYMIYSIQSEKKTIQPNRENEENMFISPYKKINSFDAVSDILCFEVGVFQNWILVVLADRISFFEHSGKHLYDFQIEEGVRDVAVYDLMIYLLYPTKIVPYALKGCRGKEWEACSNNSDYCAITASKEYIFVTDAENKHIVQYDKQGKLVRFIKSREGFVIPSYSFDIINVNDTIYCSNSGRHKVESYTVNGKFIASFGKAGTQVGAFSGCCNPVYLAKNTDETILTSEKGNPRISCYEKNGDFREILFDNKILGDETNAYKVRIFDENIYIASGKTISVYGKDAANYVVTACPTNVKSCAECPMRDRCKK